MTRRKGKSTPAREGPQSSAHEVKRAQASLDEVRRRLRARVPQKAPPAGATDPAGPEKFEAGNGLFIAVREGAKVPRPRAAPPLGQHESLPVHIRVLEAERVRRAMSRNELCQRAGLALNEWSRILRGGKLTVERWLSVAEVLEVPVHVGEYRVMRDTQGTPDGGAE